jgi:hypothetical protein
MTRRRLLLFALAAAVVLFGASIWLLWPRACAITQENIDRIKVGMTFAEVEQILGGPPRDENHRGALYIDALHISHAHKEDDCRQWIGQEHGVTVYFADQRVSASRHGDVVWLEESFLDRLRRWLGL